MNKENQFYDAIKINNINEVKNLIRNHNIDPSNYNNKAIILANKQNYSDIVDYLWRYSNVTTSLRKYDQNLYHKLITKDEKFTLFIQLIKNRDVNALKKILQDNDINPSFNDNQAIRVATSLYSSNASQSL